MKKFVSMFLIMAMIMVMSVPAFAVENTSVTINDAGRTYVGYKLLDLSTSLMGPGHHPDCGGVHNDDCYNYAYQKNDKYFSILQAETWAHGRNELWIGTGGKPGAASGVFESQVLEYLEYQSSDNGDVYMTMRQVADRIYRAIQAAGLDPDVTLTGGTGNINQGYWLFVDVTSLSGNEANSLAMVDTKGQDALTINPKTALASIEMKVKDIEDSEDGSITDNPWHDSADHDMGDAVPFKLTGSLASNAMYYSAYKMVFHNTLSEGYVFVPGSVKVYMYDTKYKADVDTDLNDYAKDVTANFVLKTDGIVDGCSFEVGCDNVLAIDGVTKDSVFVVSYTATLDTDAVLGAAGNVNSAFLEFSNNPYGNGTGKSESDINKVFTYKLLIHKTDSHGHELEGAGFTLYKKNVGGTYDQIGAEQVGGAITTFEWVGLDDGDYKLVESTVPDGYNPMEDVVFSITGVHTENGGDPTLTSLDGGLIGVGNAGTGVIEKEVVNHTGTVLPETGAAGTMWLLLGGAILVFLASVFMITRKKMSVYED